MRGGLLCVGGCCAWGAAVEVHDAQAVSHRPFPHAGGAFLPLNLCLRACVCAACVRTRLAGQDHYDYGLRSLRGVLMAAGALKRAQPELNEEFIMLQAIRDMNMPKFIKVIQLRPLLLSPPHRRGCCCWGASKPFPILLPTHSPPPSTTSPTRRCSGCCWVTCSRPWICPWWSWAA